MEARVFEKFTRGEKESAKPGIGLGLAICRAIVEAHGGTIGALNRVSADGCVEGARFWFTLPVETPPEAPDGLDDEGAGPLAHAGFEAEPYAGDSAGLFANAPAERTASPQASAAADAQANAATCALAQPAASAEADADIAQAHTTQVNPARAKTARANTAQANTAQAQSTRAQTTRAQTTQVNTQANTATLNPLPKPHE
jgi:hypothetical protein